MLSSLPENGNDGYKACQVEDNDEDLELWKHSRHDSVHQNADHSHEPRQQGALPEFGIVVWIIEDDQTLEDCASKETFGSNGSDPGQTRQPADHIAAEDLPPWSCKYVYPVWFGQFKVLFNGLSTTALARSPIGDLSRDGKYVF
jgi:hypothetical protein